MGLTRKDLEDPRVSEQDKKEIAVVLERFMENDKWATKALEPVGVLLTSHPGNRAYLHASIESHKKLGYWITLAYDNYFDPERLDIPWDHLMPSRDTMNMVDTFIMPHHQTWGGVLYPYFWLLKFGLSTMVQFEYVYCSNGDCILEKPENFHMLMDRLGDADIIGCGWEGFEHDRPLFNTTAFLAKTDAALAIMEHFESRLIPFEEYEKYTQEVGNTERRFAIAIQDLQLEVVGVEPGFNTQFHEKGHGTWYDLLGFRHIHAEHGYAYKHRLIPPEVEYFDGRHMGDEFKRIKGYWETKDQSYLEDWWPRQE